MNPVASALVLPFAELLDELRRHGFVIGLDQHLRLQRLLDHLADGCPPERLKTHLCPVFATSREEQERFHRIFDRLYPAFAAAEAGVERAAGEPEESLVPPRVTPSNSWIPVAAAAVITLALVVLAIVWRPSGRVVPVPAIDSIQVQPGPTPRPNPATDSMPLPPAEPAIQPVVPDSVLPPGGASLSEFLARHRTGARILVVALPLVLFLLNEWRLYRRRRLVVTRQRRERPPFTWPVRIEAPINPFADSAELPEAARFLRQREAGDVERLSVQESIGATIAALGFPTFRYRADTRPPEYLVLIERAAYRDHRARLFQSLGGALDREGVHTTRYLHDGDPRVCYAEETDQRELLTDLRRRFPEHRLLLFGSGERLVDPVSGRLHPWTTQLLSWSDRAILTPESPASWGLRELALAQHLVVLPATTAGLTGVVGHFDGPTRPDARRWQGLDAGPAVPGMDSDDPLPALQRYLGPRAYRWLCACAVYPELHWDLTLHFGGLPIFGPGLITEENLLRLLRLPWFRQGVIPDEIRARLVDELTEAEERAVREAIVELLEGNPAPGDSVSANRHELDLVVQRLALHRRDPKERAATLKELAGFPRRDLVQDFAMLKLLEELPPSRLAVLLPRRLRRVFYHEGVASFGIRPAIRSGLALLAAVAGLFFLRGPDTEEPEGELAFVISGSFSGDTLYLLPTEVGWVPQVKVRAVAGNTINEPTLLDSVTYRSSDPDIAEVLGDSIIGRRPGVTRLVATAPSGKRGFLAVKVDATRWEFGRNQPEAVSVGEMLLLRPSVPTQGSRWIARGIAIEVSDTTIARWNGFILTARAPGSVTIRARGMGQEESLRLVVTGAGEGDLVPASLILRPDHLEMTVGAMRVARIRLVSGTGKQLPLRGERITSSSENPAVASYDVTGDSLIVTGMALGTTVIRLQAGELAVSLRVNVGAQPPGLGDSAGARDVARKFGKAVAAGDLGAMLKLYPRMPVQERARYEARFRGRDTTDGADWGKGDLVVRANLVTIRSTRLTMIPGADGKPRPVRLPRIVTLMRGPDGWTIVNIIGDLAISGVALDQFLQATPDTGLENSAEREAIEAAVRALARALEDGDLRAALGAFPEMPAAMKEGYANMFGRGWRLGTDNWRVSRARIEADTALLEVTGLTQIRNAKGQTQHTVVFPRSMTLVKREGKWKIHSIDGTGNEPDPSALGIGPAPEGAAGSVPPEAFAAYGRALLQEKQGNPAQAIEYFRDALRIYPEYPEALAGLTRVVIGQRVRDWARHIERRSMTGLLQMYPEMPERDQVAWRRLLDNPSVTSLSAVPEDVTVELADKGSAIVRYAIVYTVDSRPGGRQVSVSRYQTTFTLTRGAWLITGMRGLP